MDHPRRSHTSLKHLSISPLTPSYPLPPTTPSPPLHTSTSYSYLASPTYPSTATLLSRSSSRTRLRSSHASPQPITTSISTPTFPNPTARPAHHKRVSASTIPTSASPVTSPTASIPDPENNWLLRTASTLHLQRMEEKGQTWLATRESSTSLTNIGATEDMADDELSPYVALHAQPHSPVVPRSRYASRMPSRLGSRAGSGAELRDDVSKALTSSNVDAGRRKEENDISPGPDFVDPAVFEDEDALDEEEEEEEEVNESEMKRVIMGRAKGWVDWAVGWMDLRGEEELWDDGSDDDDDDRDAAFKLDERSFARKQKGGARRGDGTGGGDDIPVDDRVVAPPPGDGDAGALADARWLLGLARRLIV